MDPTLFWQIKVIAAQLLIFNVIGWAYYFSRQSRQVEAKVQKPVTVRPRNLPLRAASQSQN